MAYRINVDNCSSCAACESECPNGAIKEKRGEFVIDASVCTECDGASPKCLDACATDAIEKD